MVGPKLVAASQHLRAALRKQAQPAAFLDDPIVRIEKLRDSTAVSALGGSSHRSNARLLAPTLEYTDKELEFGWSAGPRSFEKEPQ
jgi:hypothetical protein